MRPCELIGKILTGSFAVVGACFVGWYAVDTDGWPNAGFWGCIGGMALMSVIFTMQNQCDSDECADYTVHLGI